MQVAEGGLSHMSGFVVFRKILRSDGIPGVFRGFGTNAVGALLTVYWVNRGLCHFRHKEWARVEEDSRRALVLDDTSVKGHYLLGCALLLKGNCALTVKEFDKASDLLKSSNSRDKMAEDI
ncbi:E3 ubiquitin-protein ligase CHIP-like [Triticum dicoccoides]|uniref:E3 ubiquitin-protein ligase CHIP-like n=1 Tax=Triticum dicoccoides TaxID=85692 RepID=UPI00188DE8D6|nr:E3 ubiquitin-protein ligase CHIP-like [Triticum dicoccoides]XP_044320185.1 E3 ubiquitin-protein ligase CHIP-like [Triticum aestivum]